MVLIGDPLRWAGWEPVTQLVWATLELSLVKVVLLL